MCHDSLRLILGIQGCFTLQNQSGFFFFKLHNKIWSSPHFPVIVSLLPSELKPVLQAQISTQSVQGNLYLLYHALQHPPASILCMIQSYFHNLGIC